MAVPALVMALAMLAGCAASQAEPASGADTMIDPVPGAVAPAASPDMGADAGSKAANSHFGDYLAARHAERQNDPGRAARLYARVLSREQDDPFLLRQVMGQSIAAGQVADSVDYARRLLDLGASSEFAELAVAVDDMASGRHPSAAARMQSLSDSGLAVYFAPLLRAWALLGAGDTDGALAALAPLADQRGFSTMYKLHAALIHEQAGNTGMAAELYRYFLDADAVQLREAVLAGNFFERNNDRMAAENLYRRYLSADPEASAIEAALTRTLEGTVPAPVIRSPAEGAADGLWNLSFLLNQQRASSLALQFIQLSLFLDPDSDFGHLLHGNILADLDNQTEALAVLDAIDRSSPLSWNARLRAADILDRMDRTAEAAQRLEKMAAERPGRSDAVMLWGDMLRQQKRFSDAAATYDEALVRTGADDPNLWGVHYVRGIAHERMGDWPAAERDFLAALALEPDQPLVLNYLGYSWIDRNENLTRALEMIVRAVELRPNDGYIVDSLGWAHYKLGDYDAAVRHLESAVELRPHDAAINDHLGDAYWQVGRRIEAKFQWRRALALEPEEIDPENIRRKLKVGLPLAGRRTAGAVEATPAAPSDRAAHSTMPESVPGKSDPDSGIEGSSGE